jgi:hypothetical protein
MKDINKIIKHPEIQKVIVLAKILDESSQQIENWRNRGVSERGQNKIEQSEILKELNFNLRPLTQEKIKRQQSKATNFINTLDLKEAAEKTGASIVSLRMCRFRGAVTLNIARKLNKSMDIPFSTSRPDVPLLAFKNGVELWSLPEV